MSTGLVEMLKVKETNLGDKSEAELIDLDAKSFPMGSEFTYCLAKC